MKNRKSNHLSLRKRGLVILILVFSLVGFMSCERDDFSESSSAQEKVGVGTNPFTTIQIIRDCNKIEFMKFPNINSLYNKHLELYTAYMAGEQDEQVLVNFENTHNFFSLRKKDNMIDDGLLFDDVNFDPFDYTTDPILESFLNEKGQFIIGNDVYIVDDLCVWYKAPFSCESAEALVRLRELMIQVNHSGNNAGINQEIYNIKTEFDVEIINSCDNPIYDFEAISENGGRVDDIVNPNAKDSGCGHQAFIEHEVLSFDIVNLVARYRLTSNHISIASPDNVSDTFSFIGNAQNVTILQSSPLGFPTSGSTYQENTGVYQGRWVEIEVDISNINTLEIGLTSLIGFGQGNGCYDSDKLTLDLICPVSISKKPLTPEFWEFKVTGINAVDYQNFNNGVEWNFGDGATEITGLSVTHKYDIPCSPTYYDVSATREAGFPCGPNVVSTDSGSPVVIGDPCKFDVGKVKGNPIRVDGRKVRTKLKLKRRKFSGTSVFKICYRYRKNGTTKAIATAGNIYKVTGSSCPPIPISSKITPESKTGKKALRVKFKESGVNYKYDANDPFQVTFTTTNGYSNTLSFSSSCTH